MFGVSMWWVMPVVLVVGLLLGPIFKKVVLDRVIGFFFRRPVIKDYWLFVFPFVVIAVLAYVFLPKYLPEDHQYELLGFGFSMIFAIFIGYFAFLQVVEARVDKLIEYAHGRLRQKELIRAAELFEQVLRINRKDVLNGLNLAECYMVLGLESDVDRVLKGIERFIKENRELMLAGYIKAGGYLLKGHLHEATEEIQKIILLFKDRKESIGWDFRDLQNCNRFVNLTGDAKKFFDNLIRYLLCQLSDVDRQRYEAGDYRLDPMPVVVS